MQSASAPAEHGADPASGAWRACRASAAAAAAEAWNQRIDGTLGSRTNARRHVERPRPTLQRRVTCDV